MFPPVAYLGHLQMAFTVHPAYYCPHEQTFSIFLFSCPPIYLEIIITYGCHLAIPNAILANVNIIRIYNSS